MSKSTSQEMAKAPSVGLLPLPVTHIKPSDKAFNEAGDRSNLQWLSSLLASGLFAGSGSAIVIEMGKAARADSGQGVLRPVRYEDLFAERLSEVPVDGNPLGIWRRNEGT